MATEGIELPKDYAPRRARERLVPWWRGAAGDAVRRHGGALWPGVPPMALLSWSITAMGPTELGPEPDYVCGLWGVERGRLVSLVRDAEAFLGREVSAELTRDGYLRDVEAQAVCGLLNYRRHLDGVLDDVDPAVSRAILAELGGPAAWRFAAMAYSSGGGVLAPMLDAAASLLVGEPSTKWAPILGEFVATFQGDKIRSPRTGRAVSVRGKWRAAFCCLRVEQRAEGAVALGREVLSHEGATLAEVEELASLEKWVSSWTAEPARAATVARLKVLADGGR